MAGLRLDAMDTDDLRIVSAHVQDAITSAAECRYREQEGRFLIAMNRFVWERAGAEPSRWRFLAKPVAYERRRAILDFARVRAVRQSGIDASRGDGVLSLLAIRFETTDEPAGTIELVFAGGGTIRLDVECVEARLTDEAAAWSTRRRPDHDRDER